ncbi:hypothetical protein EZS27_044423, partial [termite gut metagenome]
NMEHPENSKEYKGLTVNQGIEQPSSINPYIKNRRQIKKRELSINEFVEGIIKGNVTILSQTVTLIESIKPEHQAIAQEVIEKCLPYSGNSFRIGILHNCDKLGTYQAPPRMNCLYAMPTNTHLNSPFRHIFSNKNKPLEYSFCTHLQILV